MSARNSFFGSAKLIAAWTLASRVTGLVRDILINAAFGQGWVQDAFNYGFIIPNLFRRLFGEGALSAVFVPTFTETLQNEGPPAAWRLLGQVLARIACALAILTVVCEAVVVAVVWVHPAGRVHALTLNLTAIMLPFAMSICVIALFSSILNCLGQFGGPAAMPIVLNLSMIAGICVAPSLFGALQDRQVYGVALSVLAAGLFQLVFMWPMLRRAGVQIRLTWGRDHPALRTMRRAFIPVLFGQGALLLGSLLDTQICTFLARAPQSPPQFSFFGRSVDYPLQAGALSAVTNAQRLYQFPLGVLAISLATAALPTLSRLAAERDVGGLRTALGRGLRLALFEGLPCGLMLCVLAEPIIRLLFEHGQYTPEHTARAAAVLRWYGLGVWAFCLQHVILRGFYSLKDTRTPMWIGAGLVALNLAISLALIWVDTIREAAFGIAATITAVLNVAVSLCLLRRRLGGLVGGRLLAGAFVRTSIATVVAVIVAYAVREAAIGGRLDAHHLLQRAVDAFAPLAAAGLCYLAVARVLRMEEVAWVLKRRGSESSSLDNKRPSH